MSPTGIQDLCLEWPANQLQRITVVVTLGTGRTISDWTNFVFTIREDPDYPRTGADTEPVNPINDVSAWELTSSTAGTVASSTSVVFSVTVPSDPGYRRYAFDVRGYGGTAGQTAFIPATWLSVIPSVYEA